MSKRHKRYNKVRFPLPQCDEELELVSKWYFGTPLHVNFYLYKSGDQSVALYSGSYEVVEDFDKYDPFKNAYKERGCSNYDLHSVFWDQVIEDIQCGGTARASYGQFLITKKRWRHAKRLLKWQKLKRDGIRSVPRSSFMRLASRLKEGEERTK